MLKSPGYKQYKVRCCDCGSILVFFASVSCVAGAICWLRHELVLLPKVFPQREYEELVLIILQLLDDNAITE